LNDSVFCISEVVTYSERSGDLNSFSEMVPGSVKRYPKPNYFQVIKDGDNIPRIVIAFNNTSFFNPNGYDLDSLFVKPQFTKVTMQDSVTPYTSVFYNVDKSNYKIFDLVNIDSIGFYVESSQDTTFNSSIKFLPDDFDYYSNKRVVQIVPGKNLFKFKYNTPNPQILLDQISKNGKANVLQVTYGTVNIKNWKILVWFKK
jgi:hypothetical protein